MRLPYRLRAIDVGRRREMVKKKKKWQCIIVLSGRNGKMKKKKTEKLSPTQVESSTNLAVKKTRLINFVKTFFTPNVYALFEVGGVV